MYPLGTRPSPPETYTLPMHDRMSRGKDRIMRRTILSLALTVLKYQRLVEMVLVDQESCLFTLISLPFETRVSTKTLPCTLPRPPLSRRYNLTPNVWESLPSGMPSRPRQFKVSGPLHRKPQSFFLDRYLRTRRDMGDILELEQQIEVFGRYTGQRTLLT